jgi:hypothetical protein
MRPYSEAVKADVRRQMSPPNWQSVLEIPRELGIHAISAGKVKSGVHVDLLVVLTRVPSLGQSKKGIGHNIMKFEKRLAARVSHCKCCQCKTQHSTPISRLHDC